MKENLNTNLNLNEVTKGISVSFYEDAHKLYNGYDLLTQQFANEEELNNFVQEFKKQYPDLQWIKDS